MTQRVYDLIRTHIGLTDETAAYPPEVVMTYPIAGLIGESGETVDKIKKIMRRGIFEIEQLPPEDRTAILYELGDITWYACRCIRDSGIDPETHGTFNIQTNGTEGMVGLFFQGKNIVKWAVAAGDDAEAFFHTDIRGASQNIFYHSMKVLRLVGGMATMLESSLEEVIEMNRAKLLDRRARNVIVGEGDNR